jgi:hypothetical protein
MRASKELEWLLESAWRTIESVEAVESEDRVASLKQQQDQRIEMGLVLDSSINGIKKEFIAGLSDKSPAVVQFQVFLESFEKKLDALIASRPVQEGLTPESQRRQGVLRDGVVVDPAGHLEKAKKNRNQK